MLRQPHPSFVQSHLLPLRRRHLLGHLLPDVPLDPTSAPLVLLPFRPSGLRRFPHRPSFPLCPPRALSPQWTYRSPQFAIDCPRLECPLPPHCSTAASSLACRSSQPCTIPPSASFPLASRACPSAIHAAEAHFSRPSSMPRLWGPLEVSALSTLSACLSLVGPAAKVDTPAQVGRNTARPDPSFPCLPRCFPASTALDPPCCTMGSGLPTKPVSKLQPACRRALCNRSSQSGSRPPP